MSYTFRGLTLPDDLEASLRRYVDHGVPTGHFLQACIENDLHVALSRADEDNFKILPAVMAYLYQECPAYCWGFKGAFERWIETRHRERVNQRQARQEEKLKEDSHGPIDQC